MKNKQLRCKNCGASINEGQNFCINCGAEVIKNKEKTNHSKKTFKIVFFSLFTLITITLIGAVLFVTLKDNNFETFSTVWNTVHLTIIN